MPFRLQTLKHSQRFGQKCAFLAAAFLFSILVSFLPQKASAQTKLIRVGNRLLVAVVQFPKFQSVRISGVVNIGDEAKISEALSGLIPGKNIRIWVGNFGGGWMPTVNGMRAKLEQTCRVEKGCRIHSYVQEGRECTSACIVLFMTGQVRTSGLTSVFGFHSAYVKLPFKVKIPGYGKNAYAGAGVSTQWLATNSGIMSGDDVTYIHGEDLKDSNIVTRVIDMNRLKMVWTKAP